jgi:hypothetical protein
LRNNAGFFELGRETLISQKTLKLFAKKLPQLRELAWTGSVEKEDSGIAVLNDFKNLKILSIRHSWINEAGALRTFAAINSLTEAHFSACPNITAKAVALLFSYNQGLQLLGLTSGTGSNCRYATAQNDPCYAVISHGQTCPWI